MLIRPEQIDLRPSDDALARHSEAPPTGRVVKAGYHGHDILLHVQINDTNGEWPLVVRTLGDTQLPTGAQVTLTVRNTVLVMPS